MSFVARILAGEALGKVVQGRFQRRLHENRKEIAEEVLRTVPEKIDQFSIMFLLDYHIREANGDFFDIGSVCKRTVAADPEVRALQTSPNPDDRAAFDSFCRLGEDWKYRNRMIKEFGRIQRKFK